jgi:putative addiction module component (TIGR02574 family)
MVEKMRLRPQGAGMSTAAILQAFTQLQPSQQIQLVEDMWDRIAQSEDPMPLSAGQKKELRSRKTALKGQPAKGRSWEEVRSSLLDTHGR